MKVLLVLISLLLLTGCGMEETPYQCEKDEDCVSTCGMGCVNKAFAESYEDTCVNVRAFDCSCEEKQCYNDRQAPIY